MLQERASPERRTSQQCGDGQKLFSQRMNLFIYRIILVAFVYLPALVCSQPVFHSTHNDSTYPAIWIPDNNDGTYRNPVIYADYSDPDVIRVDDDYYMISSSFSHFPGIPVLHSKDLVNWKIISHAVRQYPYPEFDKPQHGMAIWAPSLRYHNGEFYIYFGDPDRGIFRTKAKNPAGPWEPLVLIRKVTGWIDPCPFWDDDGNAFIVHAWANSRVGIKSILAINKMDKDGSNILDDGIVVFVGHAKQPTIEGPKLYKRNGFYYIFAPAGGVKPGWQAVLRSKNIFGPYEDRIVLEQGSTTVNGPHQGAWIDTKSGEDWFVHFQDRYAFGRIVHLQPMRWENDWPIIGVDYNKNGIGEPVPSFKKPDVGKTFPREAPQTTDEFDSSSLGLQWQWEANDKPDWISFDARKGWMRMYAQRIPPDNKNLWTVPNILAQKLPAPDFRCTAKLEFAPKANGEKVGLVMYGMDYSYIAIEKTDTGYLLSQNRCLQADKGSQEELLESVNIPAPEIYLRIECRQENKLDILPQVLNVMSYSIDGENFQQIGKEFTAREGQWVGAKIGIFVLSRHNGNNGYADVDWFRFEKMSR